MKVKKGESDYLWGLVRISLGLIFLWAFFDKLFGLGFATQSGKAWLNGVSPTLGFLKAAVKGPFLSFYHGLAGQVWVDILFMAGLLFLGLALTWGPCVDIAAYTGCILMLLLYSALIPPVNHPFLDEHIIYALVLLGLAQNKSGRIWGLGKWWSSTSIVKQYPWME